MASRNYMQRNFRSPRPRERPPITPVLRVAVQGSEIVVTASDTDYVMTYHKPVNSPQLLARSFPRKEDRSVSMTLADFLRAAWKLENDKARELGWIVRGRRDQRPLMSKLGSLAMFTAMRLASSRVSELAILTSAWP
jgi:hypothetical protein